MDLGVYETRHRELLLPVVRIRAEKSTGSGTVVYSKGTLNGRGQSTYVLTNCHVVSGLIQLRDEWNSLLQRNVKKDTLAVADIDFFEYAWDSRAVGAMTIQSDIVAYDKNEDLALLHLRSPREVLAVAKLYPCNKELDLRASMPVYCVGAGMGESPVITTGMLSQFGIEINNREFWMATAPAIFGNSGGALFLGDVNQLLGVPALLAVSFFGQTVTHLMYAIPITRIYEFLEAQRFRFIYDTSFTEEGEAKEREKLRKQDEARRLGGFIDDTADIPL